MSCQPKIRPHKVLFLAVALLLSGNVVKAHEPLVEHGRGPGEGKLGEALTDTPYINSLLVEREFPLIGGRWGWEMFLDAPLNAEPDGAEPTLRRARATYGRDFGNRWRLKLTGDYTKGGGLELSDNYISYSGWNRALLTLGISDVPFSLESVSRSAALTFMERGLPVMALSEGKSGAVTVLRRSASSILNASLVLFNVSRDDLREEGQGIVLHYVHSPISIGHAKSVHLGASLSYRWNASEDGTWFRTRPEVATVDDYFVDTGPIADADQIGRLSLEASRVAGRFSWQSELLAARVRRDGAAPVDFWGAYAYVSWFLTGDSRNYHFGTGRFEQTKVGAPLFHGGPGAYELAFRASLVDLTDRDVIGGRQENLSLGLNWYLNNRTRLMANLVKVLDVDRPGSGYDGLDPLIFSVRAQWVLD